ncbi:hypothetical protein CNR22_16265 [Sphingobacteriaceae bacterium]|nr:hypothetical protein CNR22_16265 [Sphingobacteriaceae bacterium]
MQNNELIKDLKETFSLMTQQSSQTTLAEGVRSAVRTINRLSTDKSALNLHLKKIAADLTALYANQLQYWELLSKTENPGLKVKPEFDESFFNSLAILRQELFQALEKL